MTWIKYSILFMAVVLIPLILVGCITPKKMNDYPLCGYHTDTLKGIAILSILLCHSASVFGKGNDPYTPLGGIGVAMFLILSGYGLSKSWKIRGGNTTGQKE